MLTQIEKARAFHAPHGRSGTFMIPNPWDPGSTRLLVSVGFEALTSTSAGLAFSRRLPDYGVDHDTILAHMADLTAATDVLMAADLEDGFGDAPETVAETIRLAGATGIVGGSIEDAASRADASIYSLEASVDHVRTVVETARALPPPPMLTACSGNHLHGRNDLADATRRLQAFQDAGVDVLYVPGLKTRNEVVAMLHEIDRSLNVLMGLANDNSSVVELTGLGIERISVGATLTRVVMGAFVRAAEELYIAGIFSFVRGVASRAKLNDLSAPFA